MSVCGLKKVRYILVLVTTAILLPLQACDIAYVSKITIKERAPIAADPTENETTIRSTFEDFCSRKGFSAPWGMNVLRDKDTKVIEQCEKAWFYNLKLSEKQDTYEVELLLVQPGPYRTKTKVFCSETAEMSGCFRTALDSKFDIIVDSYSGCR